MAPMLSVAKKDKKNLERIDKVFKNNKDNLIRIRDYIEKILNLWEKILVKK